MGEKRWKGGVDKGVARNRGESLENLVPPGDH